MSGSVRREELVLLATKLVQPKQQQQLVRLGQLLGGRVVDTFSASGRFKRHCNVPNVSHLRLRRHSL